jgi:CRP/FNR family cyclic AMP-dependent transcriptional regulator
MLRSFDGSILENSPLFADLDRSDLDRLARYARLISVEKNGCVFKQGEPSNGCYSILDGVLRVSVESSDGRDALLAMVGAGDVIGEMGLISNQPRSATVTALSPSSLAFLEARDFWHVADSNPLLYRHLLEILSNRVRATNEAAASPQLLLLPGRLAKTFLQLSELFGEPHEGQTILIRQKFTQYELAEITGAARENVNRQIRSWIKDGLISRKAGYYCLEDISALRKLVRF